MEAVQDIRDLTDEEIALVAGGLGSSYYSDFDPDFGWTVTARYSPRDYIEVRGQVSTALSIGLFLGNAAASYFGGAYGAAGSSAVYAAGENREEVIDQITNYIVEYPEVGMYIYDGQYIGGFNASGYYNIP